MPGDPRRIAEELPSTTALVIAVAPIYSSRGYGVNPKFVQELLGHADISLTLNVYSHVLPDMGDAAAGAMDDALG